MTANNAVSTESEGRVPPMRLVSWPPVAEPSGSFSVSLNDRLEERLAIVPKPKQGLLDDLRKLVLRGVEPRSDGLERSPTEHSLAVAEQLILSLPDDVAMPSGSLPDDGEITFSWQTVDNQGELWRAVLAIAPDSEVECFVRRRSDHRPVAHFRATAGVGPLSLPDHIVKVLSAHWPAA